MTQEIKDKIEADIQKSWESANAFHKEGLNPHAYRWGFYDGYSLRDEEVEKLNEIIETKESERKQWADMCIKKQIEIDRLKSLIEKEIKDGLCGIGTEAENEKLWQQFKSENNL